MATMQTLIVKTLTLEQIHKHVINEIGNLSLQPNKWTQISNTEYAFIEKTETENLNVLVILQNFDIEYENAQKEFYLPPKLWNSSSCFNIVYLVNNTQYQFKETNIKVLLHILTTVIYIVIDFINKNNPDCVYIEPTGKIELGNNRPKKTLYGAYIEKQFDLLHAKGYNIETRRDGYVIYKDSINKKR